jgi:lipid-A-disaccharide synthase-like uncharacterized protein
MKEISQLFEFTYWDIIGFIGQGLFGLRFLVQWIASEKRKKSYIPLAFWYISLAGSIIILVYAFIKKEPVFFCGQLFGSVIYIRNIILYHNNI